MARGQRKKRANRKKNCLKLSVQNNDHESITTKPSSLIPRDEEQPSTSGLKGTNQYKRKMRLMSPESTTSNNDVDSTTSNKLNSDSSSDTDDENIGTGSLKFRKQKSIAKKGRKKKEEIEFDFVNIDREALAFEFTQRYKNTKPVKFLEHPPDSPPKVIEKPLRR